jgi:hypothetical protein
LSQAKAFPIRISRNATPVTHDTAGVGNRVCALWGSHPPHQLNCIAANIAKLPNFVIRRELICVKALSGHPPENNLASRREFAMLISAIMGYVAFLITLGFAIAAVFWAADKHGLLDLGKKRRPKRVRHHRVLHSRR